MENELVKKFAIYVKKDYSLYEMFLNGTWYPNYDEFKLFIDKQNKNNMNFAKTINKYNLIRRGDIFLETSSSSDYTVLEHLKLEGTNLKCSLGDITVDPSFMDNIRYNTCYLSNGIYKDTKYLIDEVIGIGSFIIGICDNEKSDFFKSNMELIKNEEKRLNKKHINYKKIKHDNHRDKTYILYYRRGL